MEPKVISSKNKEMENLSKVWENRLEHMESDAK